MTKRPRLAGQFFRHPLLWSYRIDVFVGIALTSAFFLIASAGYIMSVNAVGVAAVQPIAERWTFREADEDVLTFVKALTLQTPVDTTPILDKLRSDNVESGFSANEITRFFDRLPMQTTPLGTGSEGDRLIRTYLAAKFLAIESIQQNCIDGPRVIERYGVGLVFIVILVMLYQGYVINNVFYIRQIGYFFAHPAFIIVFILMISIGLSPLIFSYVFEDVFLQQMAPVMDAFGRQITQVIPSFYLPFDSPLHLHDYSIDEGIGEILFRKGESSSFDWALSYATVWLILFSSWVSVGVWIMRRFGGGLMLSCSIAAIVFAVLANLVLSAVNSGFLSQGLSFGPTAFHVAFDGETGGVLAALVPMIAVFIIGLAVRRYEPDGYILCTGYIGSVVGLAALCIQTVRVADPGIPTFLVAIGLVVACVVALEWCLRRAMFGFLYRPQP